MEDLTLCPVFLAIYTNEEGKPEVGSLRMIPIDEIMRAYNAGRFGIQTHGSKESIKIPLSEMYEDFTLLKMHRAKLESNSKPS